MSETTVTTYVSSERTVREQRHPKLPAPCFRGHSRWILRQLRRICCDLHASAFRRHSIVDGRITDVDLLV